MKKESKPGGGDRRLLRDASQVRLAEAEAGGQGGVVAAGGRGSAAAARGGEPTSRRRCGGWERTGARGSRRSRSCSRVRARPVTAGRWPPPEQPPARVVLVARTHAHGLRAAQRAIREWAAGRGAGAAARAGADRRCAGPATARAAASWPDLVAGGVPAVWSLPWIEAWRVGEPPAPRNAPKVVGRLLEDLQAMTEAAASVNANRKDEE